MDPSLGMGTDPALQQQRVAQAQQLGQSLGLEPGVTRKVSRPSRKPRRSVWRRPMASNSRR
jgi:hypothetical protein